MVEALKTLLSIQREMESQESKLNHILLHVEVASTIPARLFSPSSQPLNFRLSICLDPEC
jgi:hypothetical protein